MPASTVSLETISTGTGSISLESKTYGTYACTMLWEQAAGGWSRLLVARKHHLDIDYARSYRCVLWGLEGGAPA